MQRTCKQCGKTFELSESEIDFYNKKGLSLPKRCKECREQNKASAGKNVNNGGSFGMTNHTAGSSGNPMKLILAIAAVVICVAVGGIASAVRDAQHADQELQQMLEETARVAEEQRRGGESAAQESLASESVAQESSVGESAAQESLASESVAQESLASESVAQESAASENIALESSAPESAVLESSAAESAVQESTPQASNHKFRSKKLLNQHYEKHGIEMGFASAAEYEAAASAVIDNPDALYKTEQEDGDGVYYVEATNEFVILSTDGYIRTYFYPSGGISYFNRQ